MELPSALLGPSLKKKNLSYPRHETKLSSSKLKKISGLSENNQAS